MESKPLDDRKQKLINKLKEVFIRKKAAARPSKQTFIKINQIVMGWINYFRIGDMNTYIKQLGKWLRHKIRVIIVKQWKKPRTIYKNLQIINKKMKCGYDDDKIFMFAYSRLG